LNKKQKNISLLRKKHLCVSTIQYGRTKEKDYSYSIELLVTCWDPLDFFLVISFFETRTKTSVQLLRNQNFDPRPSPTDVTDILLTDDHSRDEHPSNSTSQTLLIEVTPAISCFTF
jgi:hypothetical protein